MRCCACGCGAASAGTWRRNRRERRALAPAWGDRRTALQEGTMSIPLVERMLHVEDLYKWYGDKLVLENIDLSVSAGTLCAVVGPSGCGKSTLFRLVLGQEAADSGRLLVDGNPIGGPGQDRGIVYQRYSLYPHLTVIENAMLARTLPAGFAERRRRRSEFR